MWHVISVSENGKASPCIFKRSRANLANCERVVLPFVGSDVGLGWFKSEILGGVEVISRGRLGPGPVGLRRTVPSLNGGIEPARAMGLGGSEAR
eukprot:8198457-Pyramimonas_sp.AAC.1